MLQVGHIQHVRSNVGGVMIFFVENQISSLNRIATRDMLAVISG